MLKTIIIAMALLLPLPAIAAQADADAAPAQTEKKADESADKKISTESKKASEEKPGDTAPNAEKSAPAEYSCKYFTVKMPEGWKAIVPPTEQQGNVNAIFARNTGMPVVTMVIGPNLGANAKTIAEMFSEQFKADKAPVEKNGQYSFTFPQNDLTARAFITVEGSEFMVMTIVGSQKEGRDFVKKYIHSEEYAKLLPQ